MIKHKTRKIEYGTEVTFKSINRADYFSVIAKLDNEIREEMKKNELCEIKSNESASKFITTVND